MDPPFFQLSTKVIKEAEPEKISAKKTPKEAKQKATREMEKQMRLRKKYNFHNSLEFRNTPYMLYIIKMKERFPEKSMREIVAKTAPNWQSIKSNQLELTDQEIIDIETLSKKMEEEFHTQNKIATQKAISAKDWEALKVCDFENFGQIIFRQILPYLGITILKYD